MRYISHWLEAQGSQLFLAEVLVQQEAELGAGDAMDALEDGRGVDVGDIVIGIIRANTQVQDLKKSADLRQRAPLERNLIKAHS